MSMIDRRRYAPRRSLSGFESLESRQCLAAFPIQNTLFQSANPTTRLDIHAIDLDGDGDTDLASASFGEKKFRWHENQGNGTFTTRDLPGTYAGAYAITSADLDGDKRPELLGASSTAGTITKFSGIAFDGTLRFDAATLISEVDEVRAVKPLDADSDGDIDLVVAHSDTVRWFENVSGRGNYQPRDRIVRFESSVLALTTGRANKDNFPDLFAVTSGYSGLDYTEFGVISGTGKGFTATRQNQPSTSNSIVSVQAADFDGDDVDEAIVGYENGNIAIFSRSDQGVYAAGPVLTEEFDNPLSLAIVDLDKDRDLDIFATVPANNHIRILENLGNNVFAADVDEVIDAVSPTSIVVLDIDNDSDPDVIAGLAGDHAAIRALENRTIGDVNDDGVFDSSDLVSVFIAGEYEDPIARNSTFATGDWNGDGEFNSSDLVLAFRHGEYVVGVPATPYDADLPTSRDMFTTDPVLVAYYSSISQPTDKSSDDETIQNGFAESGTASSVPRIV